MSTKTIRVSDKVVEFIQEKLKPLSGSSASDVLEEALGLTDDAKGLRNFWLIESEGITNIIAFDNPKQALDFGQQQTGLGRMATITQTKEVKLP